MLKAEIILGIVAITLSIVAETTHINILLIPAGVALFAAAIIWMIRSHRSTT